MTIVRKLTIDDIKEFLQTKCFTWDGRIKDHWKMKTRQATIEDFHAKRMVRLIVTYKNHKDEFVQRIIVSPVIFRIEKPSLRQMDNFVSFNEEWIEFLNSKITREDSLTEIANSDKIKYTL